MQFQNILGQGAVVSHMQNAIRLNKVSHAYIINGEAGYGKMQLAEAFAQAIMCAKLNPDVDNSQITFPGLEPEAPKMPEVIEPCEECISCKKASHHNHPDIIYISHEKPDRISLDEIREQLVNTVSIVPYESKRKIYILQDAELINEQGQNLLLKTIEEPPEFVTIIILTTNKDKLLPTVRSRCVCLNMTPVDDDIVKTYLMQEGIPDYQADMAIQFALGNPGKALDIARDTQFQDRRKSVTDTLKNLKNLNSKDIADIADAWTDDSDNLSSYPDLTVTFLRDVLIYKTTLDESRLHFTWELSIIREMCSMSLSAINNLINIVDDAAVKLRMQVTPSLTIEMMLHNMQKIIIHKEKN